MSSKKKKEWVHDLVNELVDTCVVLLLECDKATHFTESIKILHEVAKLPDVLLIVVFDKDDLKEKHVTKACTHHNWPAPKSSEKITEFLWQRLESECLKGITNPNKFKEPMLLVHQDMNVKILVDVTGKAIMGRLLQGNEQVADELFQ